jgi:hypothetical protein
LEFRQHDFTIPLSQKNSANLASSTLALVEHPTKLLRNDDVWCHDKALAAVDAPELVVGVDNFWERRR